MARGIRGLGLWAAIAAGIVWAQVGIALKLLVLPGYIALGDRVVEGAWFRLGEWTLLAPITLATRLVSPLAASDAAALAGSAGPTQAVLTVSSCAGVALCATVWRVLATPKWRRVGVASLVAFGLLGAASVGVVALQLHQAAAAQQSFFAMVSRVDAAHKDPATVSAAREFARRHPDSRWAGEALRIVAMAEWDAGHVRTASQLWRQFASRFRDPTAPGVAYAEYSIALCYERMGRRDEARRHHRAAIDVIRARGDGIQAWIASDAAARLSAAERHDGRHALAGYWNTKSRTFANVYSTE